MNKAFSVFVRKELRGTDHSLAHEVLYWEAHLLPPPPPVPMDVLLAPGTACRASDSLDSWRSLCAGQATHKESWQLSPGWGLYSRCSFLIKWLAYGMKTPSPSLSRAPSPHVLLELPASPAPAHTEPVQPRQGRTPWALEAGAGARAKQGEMLTLSQSMQGRCRMWREQSQTRGLIISLSLLSGLCFHLESPRDTAPSQREGEEGLSTERFSLGSGRATVVGLFLSFLWLNGCVKADFAHWENTEGSILLSPLRMELRTWSTKL